MAKVAAHDRWQGGGRSAIALLAAGLALRLMMAWLPVPELIARTMPDDAFIYFVIARNMAAGLGPTFDGLAPTNGFHPLWALLLTPIFSVASRGDLPVQLALSLSAAFDAAAGAAAGWIVWRSTAARGEPRLAVTAGMITASLYLFNPRAIQEAVNGLETGTAVLTLACCVAAWGWALERPQATWRLILFGAAAGLAVLARTDLGLIAAVLAAALLRRVGQYPAGQSGAAAGLRGGALVAIAASAVVGPWLAWSQLAVGTVVQSSAVAIPSLVAYRIEAGIHDPGPLWEGLLFPIINLGVRDALIYPGVAAVALLSGLLLRRWSSIRMADGQRFDRPAGAGHLWLPLVGAMLVVVVHTVVRWYPRGWYFVPLAWACAVAAGPALASGLAAVGGRRWKVGIGLALGLIVIAQAVKMRGEPEYRWQADMWKGAEWLASETAAGETIGAFNAGIYAYYSERRILSLDGLVDWEALHARRQKRLLDYFVDRGGTLLIDHEAYLWGSFSPFFGSRRLEEVAQLPVADTTYGPIVVYRVR